MHIKNLLISLFLLTFAQGGWNESEEIKSEEPSISFGRSMDSSESFLVIGDPDYESQKGAVHIYRVDRQKNGKLHIEFMQTLQTPSQTDNPDRALVFKQFGSDVAIDQFNQKSDTILAVGALDTEETNIAGEILKYDGLLLYKYEPESDQFVFEKYFLEKDGSGAGQDVDISYLLKSFRDALGEPFWHPEIVGKVLVTGLPNENEVHIYRQNGENEWNTTVVSSDIENSNFGQSIALGKLWTGSLASGENALVIGAPDENGTGLLSDHIKRGAVYIYQIQQRKYWHTEEIPLNNQISIGDPVGSTYTWVKIQRLEQEYAPPSDDATIFNNQSTHFGISVATDGSNIIVGSEKERTSLEEITVTLDKGEAVAYHYDLMNNQWEQTGNTIHLPTIFETTFSSAPIDTVAIKNNTVMLGIPRFRQMCIMLYGCIKKPDQNHFVQCFSHGAFTVYELRNGIWKLSETKTGKTGKGLGESLIVSDDELFVGRKNSDTVSMYKKESNVPIPTILYLLQ